MRGPVSLLPWKNLTIDDTFPNFHFRIMKEVSKNSGDSPSTICVAKENECEVMKRTIIEKRAALQNLKQTAAKAKLKVNEIAHELERAMAEDQKNLILKDKIDALNKKSAMSKEYEEEARKKVQAAEKELEGLKVQPGKTVHVDQKLYDDVHLSFSSAVLQPPRLFSQEKCRVWLRTSLPLRDRENDKSADLLYNLLEELHVDIVVDLAEDVWSDEYGPEEGIINNDSGTYGTRRYVRMRISVELRLIFDF